VVSSVHLVRSGQWLLPIRVGDGLESVIKAMKPVDAKPAVVATNPTNRAILPLASDFSCCRQAPADAMRSASDAAADTQFPEGATLSYGARRW
jgi:hypothetical protein